MSKNRVPKFPSSVLQLLRETVSELNRISLNFYSRSLTPGISENPTDYGVTEPRPSIIFCPRYTTVHLELDGQMQCLLSISYGPMRNLKTSGLRWRATLVGGTTRISNTEIQSGTILWTRSGVLK